MPTISVVIPCYNYGRYLGQAIQSVLDQTVEGVEVIVVDDGSTDETACVAAGFAGQIAYLWQANSGPSSARNAGLAAASGDYILFLDADDVLLPGSLAALAGFLDSHPEYASVYSDGYYCDEALAILDRISAHIRYTGDGPVLHEILMRSFTINSAMSRLGTIRRHGLQFDPALRITQDWDFWIQLAAHEEIGYLHVPTGLYRYHGDNSTIRDARRRQDAYIQNREKTMNSWFFDGLPDQVRMEFLRDYLVRHLSGRPDLQECLASSRQIMALTPSGRALVFQSYGLQALEAGDMDLARVRLRRSLEESPSARAAILLALSHLPGGVIRPSLRLAREILRPSRPHPVDRYKAAEARRVA